MDHFKFEYLKEGLDGNAVFDKLKNDFEIVSQFREIKAGIPLISYVSCI